MLPPQRWHRGRFLSFLQAGQPQTLPDGGFTEKFEKGLGVEAAGKTKGDPCQLLANIEQDMGIKPALIYVTFIPQAIATSEAIGQSELDNDELQVVLIASNRPPIRKRIPNATRKKVLQVARELRSQVTDERGSRSYLRPAQQLYQWMVAPVEADLQAQKIQNLVFLMDTGLRAIPIAALHNGKEFIIEHYSVGLMPSISLTDTRYKPTFRTPNCHKDGWG